MNNLGHTIVYTETGHLTEVHIHDLHQCGFLR